MWVYLHANQSKSIEYYHFLKGGGGRKRLCILFDDGDRSYWTHFFVRKLG